MKRYLRITEYTWLVLGLLCLGVTVYFFVIHDTDSAGFAMIITAFAALMYSMRRRFNRHLERVAREQEKNGKKD